MTSPRHDYTELVTCECRYCKQHAAKTGKPFPLAVYVRPATLAQTGKGKDARHGLVSIAHEPFFATAAAAMEARGVLPVAVPANA